jgi:hypothetical protein
MTNANTATGRLTGQQIIDTAPLGALIAYSDGSPRPPDRHKRKLEAWKNANGTGRLVAKTPASDLLPAHFKLHIGDFGTRAVIVIVFFKTFMADSANTYVIEQLPPPGSVRILDKNPRYTELVHLAADQSAAEAWIAGKTGTPYTLEAVA